MEVILLDKIENLGGIGDRVRVKPGYGRNYLIPQGKATLATAENIEKFEAVRAELEKKAALEVTDASARAELLQGLSVSLHAKVGPEGKLFGSIGTHDVAEAATAAGYPVERSEVRLPDGPIKVAGEHQVDLHLHTDVNVTITVNVVGEEVPGVEAVVDSLDELPEELAGEDGAPEAGKDWSGEPEAPEQQ